MCQKDSTTLGGDLNFVSDVFFINELVGVYTAFVYFWI